MPLPEPTTTHSHVVVATYGTLGDVYPYLQLAVTLQARGHRVTLVSSAFYQSLVEEAGLTFRPIRPDLTSTGLSLEAFGQRLMDPRYGARYMYREVLMPSLRDSYDDLMAATHDAELLLTHPLLLAGPLVAEKTGIHWISTVLAPLSFLSCTDPSVFTTDAFPDPHRLPVWLNRLLRAGIRWAVRSWTLPIQQLRRELHLPPRPDPLFDGQHAPSRVLALFSPHFAPPQPDWPPQARATGFVYYQHRPERPLTPAIRAFLSAGSAPIVFTLGSSAVFAAGQFFAQSLAAVQQLGCRAIFLTGGFAHAGLEQAQADPSVLVVDYVSHEALFPQASLLVHQGGIGTTAQALRAGCPMLVVPHAHDQPDNATRIRRLGVGRVLPAARYTTPRLITELTALGDPAYARRAAELRKQLATEEGAQTACAYIEAQLSQPIPAR